MIDRYRKYLAFIDSKLEHMFKEQQPFIKCKKGCDMCCREGYYPASELEYIYLMFYYNNLTSDIKDKVDRNIESLLNNEQKKFYVCPFLVDGACSVYPARFIICRTFGLISYTDKGVKRVPFCVDMGLNYSNVYNSEKSIITGNAEDGTEPLAYHIDRKFLRNDKIEKDFNIFFGDDKPLIDWLREDFS